MVKGFICVSKPVWFYSQDPKIKINIEAVFKFHNHLIFFIKCSQLDRCNYDLIGKQYALVLKIDLHAKTI